MTEPGGSTNEQEAAAARRQAATDAAASGHQNPTPREATALHMPTCDDANCQGCMPEPSFRVPHPGGLAEDFDAKRATRINIAWEDGLRHQFDRLPDGSWLLHLTNPETLPSGPSISGYTRPHMDRVLRTALEGTPGAAAPAEQIATPLLRRTPPEAIRHVADKLHLISERDRGTGMADEIAGWSLTLRTIADSIADTPRAETQAIRRSLRALLLRLVAARAQTPGASFGDSPLIDHIARELGVVGWSISRLLDEADQLNSDPDPPVAPFRSDPWNPPRTAEAMVGGVRVPPPGADAVGRFEEIVRSLREAASHAVPITVRDIDAISDLGHEMAVAVVEAAEVTTGVSRIHLWQVTAWMENMNPARDHRHFRLLVATPGRDFLSHRERIEAMILDEWERRAEASGRYTVHIQGFWALKSGFEGHELGPTALHIGGADESA